MSMRNFDVKLKDCVAYARGSAGQPRGLRGRYRTSFILPMVAVPLMIAN